MKYLTFVFLFILLLAETCFAKSNIGLIQICEADGSPCFYIHKLIVENSTLTEAEGVGTLANMLNNTSLQTLGALTPSAIGGQVIEAADQSALSLIIKGGLYSQDLGEVADEYALDPPDYYFVEIELSGASNPTTITLTEDGNDLPYSLILLSNKGTNPINIADNPGVVDLEGNASIGAKGKLWLMRDSTNSEWQEVTRSGEVYNYSAGINLTDGGSIQGHRYTTNSSTSAEIAVSQLDGDLLVTGTGAKTYTLPTNVYALSKSAGIRIMRIGTAPVYAQPSGTEVFVLPDGSETDSGDRLGLGTSSGDMVELRWSASGKIYVWDYRGTPTDEGPTGTPCLFYDAFTGTDDTGYGVGQLVGREYTGTTMLPSEEITICKMTVHVWSITGNLSTNPKDYYLKLWSLSGTSLDTELGVSDKVDSGDISAGSDIEFTFSSPVTRSTICAVTLAAYTDGTTTITYDGSNYMSWALDNENNSGQTDSAKITTDGRIAWSTDKTQYGQDAEDDLCMGVYDQ